MGRHSGMASQDEPLSSCVCAHRLWHRPLSGSHLYSSLVPGWIPWHRFWTVFFGVAFISAGVSFATGSLQRWAALGRALMVGLWLVTIHLPPVLNYLRTPGAPQDPDKWSDVFIVVALGGGSWAVAHTLRDRKDLSLMTDSDRA